MMQQNPTRLLALLTFCMAAGCASDDEGDPAGDAPACPVEVRAMSSFPALSLCASLGVGSSLGIYTVEDLQPMEPDGGRFAVLATLTLRDGIALDPPQQVWGTIPAWEGWDRCEPVGSDVSLQVGQDVLLAVNVLEEDPNEPRVLLSNMTVFPGTDDGWTHAAWSLCTLTTEEFREIAPRMYEAMATFDPETFTCEGDLFVPIPGGRRDCSLTPAPPSGADADADAE